MLFKKITMFCGFLFAFVLFLCPVSAAKFTLCKGFSYEDIPKSVQRKMMGKSYMDNKFVRFCDLSLCKVLHVGFDGKTHEGELVVANKAITPQGETVDLSKEVLEIFKELYDARYPIEKIRLIDEYDAVDEKSMQDNNSSAFVFRYIRGTERISWHSYGLAIDINPRVNPCYHPDNGDVEPAGTSEYLNRKMDQKGLIKEGDACHKAFTRRGWEWGGSWNDPKDYMHFQKFSWRVARPAPKY